jgi:excisionase family DNA binding protein
LELGADGLLTRKEAAAYLMVAVSTMARWASQRAGPKYSLVGGSARYRLADLEAYIDAQAKEPVAQTNRQ